MISVLYDYDMVYEELTNDKEIVENDTSLLKNDIKMSNNAIISLINNTPAFLLNLFGVL